MKVKQITADGKEYNLMPVTELIIEIKPGGECWSTFWYEAGPASSNKMNPGDRIDVKDE